MLPLAGGACRHWSEKFGYFFFSSRGRHTISKRDWSSDVCSSDLSAGANGGGWVGKGLARKEDNRLLRGRGKFVDDIKLRNMLYLKFVRSPYAHAKVSSLDRSGRASCRERV